MWCQEKKKNHSLLYTKVPEHVVMVNLLTQGSIAIDTTSADHNYHNHHFDDLGVTLGTPRVIPEW